MKKFNFSKGMIIGLLTLALCLTCFGYVRVSAEEETPAKSVAKTATYNAQTDEIACAELPTAYVYVVKAATGNKIKAGTSANGQMAEGKISITDLGIKATTKDVYFYVCDKEPEVDETVAANLTIKAQAAKKITVNINYTQADDAESTSVLSITAIDASKKTITNPVPVALWCAEIDGTYAAASTFTGEELKKLLDDDGGEIYVKMQGVSSDPGPAQFGSKAIKVKIAKPANAPKVKVDFVKGTVAIKNGFDYCIKTAEGVPGAEDTWTTILPYNKVGKADAIEKTSTAFTPAPKADTAENKAKFTKVKVASKDVDSLLGENAKIYLFVRKSATAKKPASKYNEEAIVIEKRADAPDFTTVTGETDEKKKTTTFVSSLADCEFLIVKAVPGEGTDLSATKWAKLTDKGLTLKKTKTKVSKTETNTLKEGSIILVRTAAVKGEKIASKWVVTTIKKTESEGTTTYTWEKKTN